MSPAYSAALGFQVGLSSLVRESEGMLKRGQAAAEDVVATEVDLGRVDVGVEVDSGSEVCTVSCSCVC